MDSRTEEQRFEDWVDKDSNWVHIQDRADALAIWIGAKHDAKPVVEIHYNKYADCSGSYAVCVHPGERYAYCTSSKEAAEAWAVANGYRLG